MPVTLSSVLPVTAPCPVYRGGEAYRGTFLLAGRRTPGAELPLSSARVALLE